MVALTGIESVSKNCWLPFVPVSGCKSVCAVAPSAPETHPGGSAWSPSGRPSPVFFLCGLPASLHCFLRGLLQRSPVVIIRLGRLVIVFGQCVRIDVRRGEDRGMPQALRHCRQWHLAREQLARRGVPK